MDTSKKTPKQSGGAFSAAAQRILSLGPAAAVVLTAAIIFLVFRDFLFFHSLYLFTDIASSDSVNSLYPQYIHIAQYLAAEGLPRWSFSQGMGQNIFPGALTDPFSALLLLAGKGAVAGGLAYVEASKILLAGLFFRLFLGKLRLSPFAATIGAVLYAFSGFLVVGSSWGIFSTEAVYLALLLYSFERLYQDDSRALFPVATALIAAFQPFDLYAFSVLILVYSGFRLLEDGSRNLKSSAFFLLKTLGLGALGAAASAFFLVNGVLQMLQSPRVAGNVSFFGELSSEPVFGLAPASQYISAVLRSFSPGIMGTGNAFMGWNNYLEAPLFYCGLLPLLLLPQLFLSADRKRRLLYGALLGLAALPALLPFFRHAFWLFSGDYYRLLSLFIALALLLAGIKALSSVDGPRPPRPLTLFLTLAALLTVLYYPYPPGTVNAVVRNTAAGFLACYALLLALLRHERARKAVKLLLLLAVAAEAAFMSYITLHHRPAMTPQELAGNTGYNDSTVDAVAWLKNKDRSFFRLEKDYSSTPSGEMSINDGKAQGYYGTTSYHSFNQINYIRFLRALDLVRGDKEWATRWAPGLRGAPPLYSFASVKYALSRSARPEVMGFGFVPLAAAGEVTILGNKYALPLGFTYDRVLPRDKFLALPQKAKVSALYKACVTDPEELPEAASFQELDPKDAPENYTLEQYARDISARRAEALEISEHGQNLIRGRITVSGKKILFFSIPFDRGWTARVDGKKAPLARVNIGFTGLLLEKGEHEVELAYTPPHLGLSAAVSLAALLLYGLLIFFQGKNRSGRTWPRR